MLKKNLPIILAIVLCLGAITISARAAGVSVTLNKSGYAANEDIKITVSGVADEMVKAGAFAGLYESGAAYNKSLKQTTLKAGSSTVAMKAPATAGTYEVRVYQRGAPCLKKVTFTVGTSVPAKTQAPTPKPTQAPTPAPTQAYTLSAAEQELVGSWSYGNVGGGFYTTWSAGGDMLYQRWNDVGSFVQIYKFNADRTYSGITYSDFYLSGNRNNKIIYTTANWAVVAEGTIHFTNYTESVDDLVNPSNSYTDKVFSDRDNYYKPVTRDGKNGLYIEYTPIEEAITLHFFEKIE